MSSALRTLGWGLYLTSSWTWCIGMFLPVIMLRHFGWAGFLAFAVPNVLGCAGFGYLCSRERSQEMQRTLAGLMRWFSLATVAYQVFFLCWIGHTAMSGGTWSGTPGPLVVLALALGAAPFVNRRERTLLIGSMMVFAASAALFLMLGGSAPLADFPRAGPLGSEYVWLVPLLVFGFLACPWLDLTFHHALQSAPSKHAFGVFGLAFAAMLMLSAAIAHFDGSIQEGSIPWPIAAQWAMQCAFTIAAHVERFTSQRNAALRPALTTLLVAAVLAGILGWLRGGEDTYLRFLGLFGWVFPVLLLLRPLRGGYVLAGIVAVGGAPLLERAWVGQEFHKAAIPMGALLLIWAVWPRRPAIRPA